MPFTRGRRTSLYTRRVEYFSRDDVDNIILTTSYFLGTNTSSPICLPICIVRKACSAFNISNVVTGFTGISSPLRIRSMTSANVSSNSFGRSRDNPTKSKAEKVTFFANIFIPNQELSAMSAFPSSMNLPKGAMQFQVLLSNSPPLSCQSRDTMLK